MQNVSEHPAFDAPASDTPASETIAVRGIASDVLLDMGAHEAIKRYRRQPVISWLYRIAFQAPFPYVSNSAALKAAQYRRRIAGLITQYALGRDAVAEVKRVEQVDGGYLFVTELVDGSSPRDHKRARGFLHEVTDAFIKSGLPTWQVSPHNPRSLGNLIETADGDYWIIDLESNVVTPMVPLGELWGAARTGHLPPFDDIDIPRLILFVSENAEDIRAKLGEQKAREVSRCIARYAWYENLWQKNEPRVWSRGVRRLAAFFDVPAHLGRLSRTVRGWFQSGTGIAENWAEASVERWEQNGVITEAQATRAREEIKSGPVIAVLAHLGGQFAMSIPLRFPLGSLARFFWVSGFRLRAEVRALTGRATSEETRTARGIHSFTVVGVAAIPGIGAAAYVLARPLRKNTILLGAMLDQAFRMLPFALYRRLHLKAVTVDIAHRDAIPEPGGRDPVGEILTALKNLATHRGLVTAVLGANALVLAAAALYFAANGSLQPFSAYGFVNLLMITEALIAGAVGVLYYTSFWAQPEAEARPGAAGTLFWLGGGIALIWLAIDHFFGVHQAFGRVFDDVPVLEHADDLVLLGYLILGVVWVRTFGHEVRPHGASLALLTAAVLMGASTVVIDAVVPAESDWMAVEKAAQLLTAALILPAFLIKYRELQSRAGAR